MTDIADAIKARHLMVEAHKRGTLRFLGLTEEYDDQIYARFRDDGEKPPMYFVVPVDKTLRQLPPGIRGMVSR